MDEYKKITVTMHDKMYKVLKLYAWAYGISFSEVIRHALTDYFYTHHDEEIKLISEKSNISIK